jgi:hypothetical protein
MKRAPGAALLVLASTLVTCSPPPFNLDLSLSAQAASRMTLVGQVGPVGNLSMGSQASQGSPDFAFLPEKDGLGGITLQAGFVHLSSAIDGEQVAFIASNGSQYQRYGGSQWLGPASTDPYPVDQLQSAKSGHSGFAVQFNDAAPLTSTYTLATGDPSTNSFGPTTSQALNVPVGSSPFDGTTKEVIGFSIRPDPSAGLDRTYWLFRQSGTSNYLEAELNLGSTLMPMSSGTALRGPTYYDLSSIVDTPNNRVLYYFDPAAMRSYASVWNSPAAPGGWSTWVWTDNQTVPTHQQLTGIANRVDALLATGEMFSTEGNVGRVYDPTSASGSLEAEFELGALRFVGEVYLGGTASVLFSQALWMNGEITFNIYSIPSAQLKSLGR